MRQVLGLLTVLLALKKCQGFQPLAKTFPRTAAATSTTSATAITALNASLGSATGLRRARDLVKYLVEEESCYTSENSIQPFVDACASNVIIEDRFYPQPFNGKTGADAYIRDRIAQRKGKGTVRIDRISDGDAACGYAWTWECGDMEGLRGTTFVELDDRGKIVYLQEIPEPLFKPGDATKDLLKTITSGAEAPPPQPYEKQSPTVANELAKYLFGDLQKAGTEESVDELMRFFDDNVIYRDFNFKDVLNGPAEVRKFVEDFTFPGIEFKPLRFDDGIDSTCFTWEVVLDGAPDTIKGCSFYELDPKTRKIVYVRDVPESAIKPPILGTWARNLRPGLGVFSPVPKGSRPGGK
mmetsp:Transcript_8456/g.16169  ORF Transcript_8456/g.16169 Transcript_8456/m.16169 type:complete len:354 (-) Transcript_8456:167-1228(-)|eukprot:scaffold703_cov168-Amphora_coffeaeformis.AAC.20